MTSRIILALTVLPGGIAGAGVLLHGTLNNVVISIGRNPSSNASVMRGVFGVGGIGAGIILMASALGYVIVVG